MAFNVDEFRSNMLGDGARVNLFQVSMFMPAFLGAAQASQKLTFMAKTAQIPESNVNHVSLYYFGREVKLAGTQRVFPNLPLTIINDEDFMVRRALESWMDSINSHSQNVRSPAALSALQYATDATVTQYGKAGDIIKEYNFIGLFPSNLSQIDLTWDTDNIEEYTADFVYQYWTSDSTT